MTNDSPHLSRRPAHSCIPEALLGGAEHRPCTLFGWRCGASHRLPEFRGVIFDIDPVFANSEEWYDAIPEGIRPAKDQPFYHLLAENAESSYVAYVSQQNLVV